MGGKVSLYEKQIEKRLSEIGAKIAKATEYSEQAANLCVDSQSVLMLAQNELSELYMSLDDISNGTAAPAKKKSGKIELALNAPKAKSDLLD